jgi:hypothetical protein
MFRRDWIEALTGWYLDHGNGSVEWLIVVAMLAAAIAIGIVARRHRTLLTAAIIHSAGFVRQTPR